MTAEMRSSPAPVSTEGAGSGMRADDGRTVRATTPEDVAVQLSFARKVVVVPKKLVNVVAA